MPDHGGVNGSATESDKKTLRASKTGAKNARVGVTVCVKTVRIYTANGRARLGWNRRRGVGGYAVCSSTRSPMKLRSIRDRKEPSGDGENGRE
jgi:hypothetical protein